MREICGLDDRQQRIAHNAKIRWMERQQSQTSTNKTSRLPYKGGEGCWKCGGSGHLSRACASPVTSEIKVHCTSEAETVSTVEANPSRPKIKAEWIEAIPQVKTKCGDCPLCAKGHTYKRKFAWGELDWPSSLLKSCPKYISMTPVEGARRWKR